MESNISIEYVNFGHPVYIKGSAKTSLSTYQKEFEGIQMSFGKGLLKIDWKDEILYVPYGNIACMREAKA